jgi:ATP-binding cassette subfamily C protein LapB
VLFYKNTDESSPLIDAKKLDASGESKKDAQMQQGTTGNDLAWVLTRIAQVQGHKIDRLRLQSALACLTESSSPKQSVSRVISQINSAPAFWMSAPDPAHLPLLCVTNHGYGVVLQKGVGAEWLVEMPDHRLWIDEKLLNRCCAAVSMRDPANGIGNNPSQPGTVEQGSFLSYVYKTLNLYRSEILEACLATVFIGLVSLATSLFSMQVYDRVIPTRSESTLIILASGVLMTILLELAIKFARSSVMDHIAVGIDQRLSREVYSQLLRLRVDQLPASVGSLAAQLRGYEQVRSFYTATTLLTLVELPIALFFLLVIGVIGHPLVASVPLVFALLAVSIGLWLKKRVSAVARSGAAISNMKTGLLVETVEGIETIKSGNGGWKFLSRWTKVTSASIENDLRLRTANESVGYLSATLQQVSYACLIVAGALVVMQGHMTMGALIACSILSGRVLAPILAIPNLFVQHAHAKAALEGIESFFSLKVDEHESGMSLAPERLLGNYQIHDVKFSYPENPPALLVPEFSMRSGERVAVLGPIGSGKSTLLKMLSGLYAPQSGRVLLDGLDVNHIHRQVMSEHVGYLQQEHRLFQGTLRENLLVGLPDPGDTVVLDAMRRTGFDRIVATHPKGLDRLIAEGGKGLSGGQRQLLAFTRLVLSSPSIWLLDEPTAAMDEEQERQCLKVLHEESNRGRTIVFVTHKPIMLSLATRIVVIVANKIVLDGPRDLVLQRLQSNTRSEQSMEVPSIQDQKIGPQAA